jgi:hypothetical protein
MAAVTAKATTTQLARSTQNPGGQFCREVPRIKTAALFNAAVMAISLDPAGDSVHLRSVGPGCDRAGHAAQARARRSPCGSAATAFCAQNATLRIQFVAGA